jgi:Tol biopolymer transport system component
MTGTRIGGVAFIPGVFAYAKEIFDDNLNTTYQQIWTVPLVGGTAAAITTGTDDGDLDSDPVVSPDGTQIAFLRAVSFGTPDLWIMDTDGGNAAAIRTSGAPTGPSWHPDGSVILFRSGSSILTIEPDGSNVTTLITKSEAFSPVYSGDAAFICFAVDKASGATADELWVMDADGTNDTQVDTLAAGGRGGLGICSPSGSDVFIYSSGGAASSSQAFKINADGTGKTDITTGNIGPAFTKWSVATDDLRVFTPDTNGASPWTMQEVPIDGSGESALSPTLDASAVVGRGQAIIAGNRLYTVLDSDGSLVSVLQDGSDQRTEDTVESGPVFFETINMTGNGTEN